MAIINWFKSMFNTNHNTKVGQLTRVKKEGVHNDH